METLPEIQNIPLQGSALKPDPFPHFSVTEAFSADKAEQLLAWFEKTKLWSFTKTNFYTQYEFSLVGLELPEPLGFLNSKDTLQFLAERFNNLFGCRLKVIDITAHKLIDGHKMGVHNDFIGKDETHRLVIQINDNWKDEKGGYLMLFNSKQPSDVAKIIRPLHNTGIGFEISDRSFHAVSAVHDFTRYTLVYTFNSLYI
ncbi:cyclophane-containing peptide 2OG-Fe(II) oxygenase YhhC [Mucilaginibacter kameinonensis]|uniref:cyclophane-containing peptide 2OG-Fe(II) oxygenase YhhC n=1 Tax=Mucilaginibacter kameinonensis TaxID=452286 RepID=UPI000EF75C4E|nr:cyclophane-containing peptide 2OG-Fe(II) oxygenase YhhC [Mucilaginibacter kameinonensis]